MLYHKVSIKFHYRILNIISSKITSESEHHLLPNLSCFCKKNMQNDSKIFYCDHVLFFAKKRETSLKVQKTRFDHLHIINFWNFFSCKCSIVGKVYDYKEFCINIGKVFEKKLCLFAYWKECFNFYEIFEDLKIEWVIIKF